MTAQFQCYIALRHTCRCCPQELRRRMTVVKYILVRLLFTIEYAAMGVSAVLTAVNSGTADNVTLSCKNVIEPDCSSTTWLYNTYRFTDTIELVTLGKIKDSHMNEKIRLGPDCSLHIHNVSTADTGSYTCRQFISGTQHEHDALVYLSILTVVPVTNLMPGSNMTLQCLLYTYHNPGQCNNHQSNSLTLRWVSDTDTDLQGDPRYQIHTSSCNSTLTTELQWTDNNRKWGCQLTDKGEVKVSQSYTITFPGNNLTSMQPLTAIPVTHSPFSTTVKQPTTNVIGTVFYPLLLPPGIMFVVCDSDDDHCELFLIDRNKRDRNKVSLMYVYFSECQNPYCATNNRKV
ncbi:uncharacterized protein [Paramormyrops kingsleyae]|uniref:uncharacterized protein isoform X3 n=1 Tax=Paramormyrops kingsleyae TaxID=1676925 RepID=UPI000CD5FAC6|nr:uncharacterized protein LOC111851172 isoform X1 [Paramormyrops kingsleyae]